MNLLGDPVHVSNLFLVADDLDGRPHTLDHLGVGLSLLHHTGHDFLIHICGGGSRKKRNQQIFIGSATDNSRLEITVVQSDFFFYCLFICLFKQTKPMASESVVELVRWLIHNAAISDYFPLLVPRRHGDQHRPDKQTSDHQRLSIVLVCAGLASLKYVEKFKSNFVRSSSQPSMKLEMSLS